jgi:hypothetical protein
MPLILQIPKKLSCPEWFLPVFVIVARIARLAPQNGSSLDAGRVKDG